MKSWPVIMSMLLATSVVGFSQQPDSPNHSSQTAIANFADAENQSIGTARLRQAPHGVVLTLELTNAQPGAHALHVHKVGRCDAPSFDSAGDHFEPGEKRHGFLNANGPHAGDLPNVVVPESRKLSAEFLVHDVTLRAGTAGLMDADGSALVLHGGRDDYATDPSGGAGTRVACAVIVAERR
jgi:Cu-Zn family superoxide dismutase